MNQDQFYIERRPEGDYAVRRGGADRASAVVDTWAEAIARARKIEPDGRFMSSACTTPQMGRATSGVSSNGFIQGI